MPALKMRRPAYLRVVDHARRAVRRLSIAGSSRTRSIAISTRRHVESSSALRNRGLPCSTYGPPARGARPTCCQYPADPWTEIRSADRATPAAAAASRAPGANRPAARPARMTKDALVDLVAFLVFLRMLALGGDLRAARHQAGHQLGCPIHQFLNPDVVPPTIGECVVHRGRVTPEQRRAGHAQLRVERLGRRLLRPERF